uniref:Uncharacterized protein n=1 Tax=Oncorhynchus tshawytscha TaxID=74940 RepID=A0AAZ3SDF2_ONCTS
MEDITLTKWFKVKEYDQKSEQRSEKHKGLRGRNNVTSCRSPTRELDTRWIKKELRRKRQQEFNIRRSVSPERAKDSGKVKDDSCVICDTAKSETVGAKVSVTPKSNLHGSQRAKDSAKVKDDSCVICDEAKTESLQCNINWPMPPGLMSDVRPLTMGRRIKTSKDDLGNSEWASIWKNEKSSTRTLEAVSSTFTTFTTSTREPPTSTFTTSTREPPTSTPTTCTSTREPPTSTPTICTSTREPPIFTPTICTLTREPPTSTPTICTLTREPPISTPTSTLKTSTPSRELVQPRKKASTKKEKGILKGTGGKKTQQEANTQTESGYVTVKESEVIQLDVYLQEALWREEGLKKKLAVLQKRGSTLLRYSDNLWATSCNEDLLKNKIRALETQLQVCLQKQKLPLDGVKKLVLQMENQKGAYEEKALEVIQRATEEKREALSQAETLEMLLQAARVEAAQWQGLCEEMKESSEQLKKKQEISSEQVLQLQNQLELARGQEAGLREELGAVQRVEEELQSNIVLLEEQNQNLRDQIHEMRDARADTQGVSLDESLAQLDVSLEQSEEEETLAQLDVSLEQSEEEETLAQLERTLAQLDVSLEQSEEEEEEEEETLAQLDVSLEQSEEEEEEERGGDPGPAGCVSGAVSGAVEGGGDPGPAGCVSGAVGGGGDLGPAGCVSGAVGGGGDLGPAGCVSGAVGGGGGADCIVTAEAAIMGRWRSGSGAAPSRSGPITAEGEGV